MSKLLAGKFEAKKHAYRQTQDGVVISFVVHPNDMTPELAHAPLGTRLMVAYQEFIDEPPPKAKNGDRSEAGKARYRELPKGEQAVIRAAALCADPTFREWAWVHATSGDPEKQRLPPFDIGGAVQWMRETLGVGSRSAISSDPAVYEKFIALETAYWQDTGQMAEVRT